MSSYCQIAPGHALHGPYHDHEYGFVQHQEPVLFERLVPEINQAGLSWQTILAKRAHFQRAYDGFDVDRVAAYGPAQVQRLLGDPGIIRNRLKIAAAIHNAQVIQQLRLSHGGFHAWLQHHHPLDKPAWVALFRKTFRFTGGEITGEFLMSLGWLPGAHVPECPQYARSIAAGAPWAQTLSSARDNARDDG